MNIKENQKQELEDLKHQIEVAKLQRELEQHKMWLPIKVDQDKINRIISAAAKQ